MPAPACCLVAGMLRALFDSVVNTLPPWLRMAAAAPLTSAAACDVPSPVARKGLLPSAIRGWNTHPGCGQRGIPGIGIIGELTARIDSADGDDARISRRPVLDGGTVIAGRGHHDDAPLQRVVDRLRHDRRVAVGSHADVDDLRPALQRRLDSARELKTVAAGGTRDAHIENPGRRRHALRAVKTADNQRGDRGAMSLERLAVVHEIDMHDLSLGERGM